MKGIRFYADIPGTVNDEGVAYVPKRITVKELREWSQYGDSYTPVNCIAVFIGEEHRCPDNVPAQEALTAVFAYANSDVNLGAVSREYLRQCRRIPEDVARRLHHRLANRLDAAE